MTTNGLKFISETLNENGVPYCFEEWTKAVTYPYTVGQYLEAEPMNEDGESETDFILAVTTNGKWIDLERIKTKVRSLFSPTGHIHMFADGTAVAVMYSDAKPVPTGTETLKRMEINLKIKEWSV